MRGFGARIGRAWSGLRTLLGDDAYERYLAHSRKCHPGRAPLDRAAFYATELERRWRQASRCC